MLENTFIHIPGVSKNLEAKIWDSGIMNWSDFFEGSHKIRLSPTKHETIFNELKISQKKLSQKDSDYFKESLPRREHWRMYPDFNDTVAFLDIETTGLRHQDDITMIGLYDGKKTKTYIKGQNLDAFPQDIGKYKVLVTFNGNCFDLPFIQSHFEDLPLNQAHIDLRWVLSRIGLRGGLKAIEDSLGFRRSEATRGLTGWDAVRLWRKYQRGDKDALDLLIQYNTEDIVNLKRIIELTYPKLVKNTVKPRY